MLSSFLLCLCETFLQHAFLNVAKLIRQLVVHGTWNPQKSFLSTSVRQPIWVEDDDCNLWTVDESLSHLGCQQLWCCSVDCSNKMSAISSHTQVPCVFPTKILQLAFVRKADLPGYFQHPVVVLRHRTGRSC